MNRVMYKGCEIQAVPFWSKRLNGWQINVYIAKADDVQVQMQHHSADVGLLSREAAVRECFEFGKKLVDNFAASPQKVLVHA